MYMRMYVLIQHTFTLAHTHLAHFVNSTCADSAHISKLHMCSVLKLETFI